MVVEAELPQIREMVLANTLRIERNEQIINEMRKKEDKERQRQRDWQTYWDISREEHDRAHHEHQEDMRELRRLMREHSANVDADLKKHREEFDAELKKHREEFDAELKQSSERFDAELKESSERFDAELKKSREDFDARFQKSHDEFEERHRKFTEESQKSREEFDKQMKENWEKTHREVKSIRKEFIGVVGHMVEGLVNSSEVRIFQAAGFDLHDSGKNLKRVLQPGNRQLEIDALLSNEAVVIPVEVKSNFTMNKVRKFLHKVEAFREFFPEYRDRVVYAAVAAINYDEGADIFAHEEGLLVIRVSSDDIFTLDPVPDKNALRRF